MNLNKLPVYVFNTETVRKLKHNNYFRTYFFLASGFKDLFLLSKSNLHNTTIIYYDINPFAIKFKKWMLSCWDGKKESLYKKIMKHEYNYALSDHKFYGDFKKLNYKEQFEHSWKVEIEKRSGKKSIDSNNLKNHYNKFFINIDITSSFEKLEEIISIVDEPIYFWFSNCFYFDYTKVEDNTSFERFLNILKKSNKTIYLSGKSHDNKTLEQFI